MGTVRHRLERVITRIGLRSLDSLDELGSAQVECGRQSPQRAKAGIAAAVLDLGEMHLGDVGAFGDLVLRQVELVAAMSRDATKRDLRFVSARHGLDAADAPLRMALWLQDAVAA
jgi:hypothetical protein